VSSSAPRPRAGVSAPGLSDVSAVVCTLNCARTIRECLLALRRNGVGEIILVDADSTDGTRRLAEGLADFVLSDPRQGLATARNIGIRGATRDYLLNVGADNVMPSGSIAGMLRCLLAGGYIGVSAVTVLKEPRSYIARSMNTYKKARYYPGERSVIGTPTLFRRQTLLAHPYDPRMTWSDDGDLCTRIAREGGRFAIADVVVKEIGSESIGSVAYRWKGYGKSDYETYTKYAPSWSVLRRIKSLLHPLRNEFLLPLARTRPVRAVALLPFLTVITFIRYCSWLRYARRNPRGAGMPQLSGARNRTS
jgi:glycosyltransferase involved in cell wall biosynthesis